ncbi:DEAD/DEAH box helicase [Mesoplasma coleopterae]|uniref:ATP-dependent RNA helicase n=1 Tax=Mesoplasma coleopterae TaxID=324078 RepID=A0A2K8P2A2_9MOLU|nr:DEAD/DEAH box helicase [Mesoplasma coleopterae]ATZ20806.1 ATP-dependent RNA helicase [Mesoplasma coleopterae]AVN62981.1 helicase [Mesoplasma coleopterae]
MSNNNERKFSDFGFKKYINDTLKDINFETPTRIQTEIIPLIKKYQNVIALSHTGTGKTHAFLLPILNNLKFDQDKKNIQALIIAPTRELAKQIYDNVRPFIKNEPQLKVDLFIGGEDINKQIESLSKRQPTIAVGTPTRIKELYEQNHLKATTSDYIIIDECDMIFDLGFIEDVDFVVSKAKQNVNLSMFSATIPEQLRPFVTKYARNAHFIDVTEKNVSSKNIKHFLIDTKNKEIEPVLTNVLSSINPYLCLIFSNHKDDIPRYVKLIREITGQNVGELHGDLQPRTRMNMLKKIKNNEFKFVVATDVAARGVDIIGVSHVISIDLPTDLSYYIHRSGRTGRSKMTGESYVLFNIKNQEKIEGLEKIGIEFVRLRMDNNQLIEIRSKNKKKAKHYEDLDTDSKKVIAKYSNQKVKPGYKKKRKRELDEITRKKRREHIKQSIDKIKKEKYRKRREELFD